MVSITRNIGSLLLLLVFIPATLGFALIHHHCGTCHSGATETAFLLIDQHHQHEAGSCFCDENQRTDPCASQEQDACSCDLEDFEHEHDHDCELQLKKLESPYPPPSYKDGLPWPAELDFSLIYLAQELLWPEQDNSIRKKVTYKSPPPPGGFELLQKIAVYRL